MPLSIFRRSTRFIIRVKWTFMPFAANGMNVHFTRMINLVDLLKIDNGIHDQILEAATATAKRTGAGGRSGRCSDRLFDGSNHHVAFLQTLGDFGESAVAD